MTRPDWQLPTGVDRGLWDYVTSASVARGYDAALAGSTLFAADQAFVERHCPGPGRLIDLGCGTGRLLLALARRGVPVVGVDLSAEMLAVAREKAIRAGLDIDLVQANLAELDAVGAATCEYAACLFSTLGMVKGALVRRQVVDHVYRILRPGGRFVLHVHNRWFHLFDPAGRKWLVRDLLAPMIGRSNTGDRGMPVHQGVAGLSLHSFTKGEATGLLRKCGFRILQVQPVGLVEDGKLRWPALFGSVRAYGFLIAAAKADC